MSERPAKENPEALALRTRPKSVMRLNRRSLIILIGGAGAVGLGACLWAFRAREPSLPGSGDLRTPTSVTRAEGLDKLPRDYEGWRPTPKLGPANGELGRPVLREEQAAGLEPGSGGIRPSPEEDAERVARLRLQEEAEAAAKAPVLFQTNHAGGETSVLEGAQIADASNSTDATRGPATGATEEGGTEREQRHKREFVDRRGDSQVYASGHLESPRSPYELMAGTVIAAALVTGINSDLPGQMIATVTQNVYDTVSGLYLLIPQGSRMIGQYDSQVAYGQRRVLLVWTRLILPDGSSVTLDRLQGTDPAGYSGLEDKVDSHWGRIFAGAAVSTLLGVNTQLVAQNQSANSGSVTLAVRQSSQDSLNQVGQQITRRNLNVQPTVIVRPGYPLRVIVNRDLLLHPYEIRKPSESGS